MLLELLLLMKNAEALFCATRANGKRQSIGWADVSTLAKHTGPWTLPLWRASGGCFNSFIEKGLIYEGFKVMPFSMKLGTPLSNFEANLNYKEVDDPSVTVAFKKIDEPNTFFLAWTTTPWTLPSNLALMVGPEHTYVKVKDPKSDKLYILAEARLAATFKEDCEIVESFSGKELNGSRYAPLFPFFADR